MYMQARFVTQVVDLSVYMYVNIECVRGCKYMHRYMWYVCICICIYIYVMYMF